METFGEHWIGLQAKKPPLTQTAVLLVGGPWNETDKPLLVVGPNCILIDQLPGSGIQNGCSCAEGRRVNNNHCPLLCTGRRFTKANNACLCLSFKKRKTTCLFERVETRTHTSMEKTRHSSLWCQGRSYAVKQQNVSLSRSDAF